VEQQLDCEPLLTDFAFAPPLPPQPKIGNSLSTSSIVLPKKEESPIVRKFRAGSMDNTTGGKPSGDSGEEYEELDRRAIEAAEWVNKEIRKLIGEIKR